MPLSTNLTSSPYFDDFDTAKNYYKVLFKPSTAVQVREMNQLQTMLQNQIEEFGDQILKAGTILSGCQFTFKPVMPYVKILDRTSTGGQVDVREYQELFARGETTGLSAKISHTVQGFQGDGTDLNTLYLEYQDNGTGDAYSKFNEGETLKIYSNQHILYDLIIEPGFASSGFSNSDNVYVVGAIKVANLVSGDTTGLDGVYTVNDILVDDIVTPTTRVQIYDTPYVDTSDNTLVLPIKPVTGDLTPAPDSSKWINLAINNVLINQTQSNSESQISEIIGSGATGNIITSRTGTVVSANITRGGSGYTVVPYVAVGSTTASTIEVDALQLTAQDYITKVSIAASVDGYSNPIGTGYGIQVSSGKIYQKGYFLNVDAQFALVDKYSNTPNDVAVGFNTVESVVNVFSDSTLYDNASDFLNFAAPGANRLKLEPKLVSKTFAEQEADSEFFPLVKFSEGTAYAQFKTTQYNKIGDMIAQRSFEESGNYSLDDFKLTVRSENNIANTDTHFVYVLDPGHAYINGYRIKTERNYSKKVLKSKKITQLRDQSSDLTYGNYIRVNHMAGVHTFKTGSTINLYSAQSGTDEGVKYYDNYYTNIGVSSARFTGNQIGTAKIRSVVLESGNPGTAAAQYRVYIFDVNMTSENFRNVRAIYSPSAGAGFEDGIADIVLTEGSNVLRTIKSTGEEVSYTPAEYSRFAEIYQSQATSLVFSTGYATTVDGQAFANTSGTGESISYNYRTTSANNVVSGAGVISHVLTADLFAYDGTLTDTEEDTLIIVPEDELLATSFATGVTLGAGVDNGDGTTSYTSTVGSPLFTTNLRAGDFIKVTGGPTEIVQIIRVDGQDKITVATTAPAINGSSLTLARVFPKNVPISMQRDDMIASVSSDKTTITINLGTTIASSNIKTTITYNVLARNVSSTAIVARRNRYVKLSSAGNFPKCLGIPGILRLKAVYNGATESAADITREFYIEDGQKDGHWGLGKLERLIDAPTTLAGTILVKLDYLEPATSGGVKTVDSFTIDDETALDSLDTSVNTLEIPYFTPSFNDGAQLNLRECFDFRPFCDLTAADATTPAAATVDPSSTVTFASSSGLAWPVPQGDVYYDIAYYQKREDQIFLNNSGDFQFNIGTTSTTTTTKDPNKIKLYTVEVPPYPSLPVVLSTEIKKIQDTRVISKIAAPDRYSRYAVSVLPEQNQNRGYTMNQIGALERRIEALEVNQNLTALETETSDRRFSSSVDPTLEKYKYGFFVDNFENYSKILWQDPEHGASIYENFLHPAQITIPLELEPCDPEYVAGTTLTFPSERYRLLSQKNATYAPYIEEPPLPAIELVCQFVTNQNTKHNKKSLAKYSELQGVWEEYTVTAPDFTDGASRNIDIRFFNPGYVAYEVLQTTTPPKSGSVQEVGTTIFTTATQTASSLSGVDGFKTYQKFYEVKDNRNNIINFATNPWFTTLTSVNRQLTDIPATPDQTYKAYKGAGIISVPYDYTKGKYITIRALKWGPVFNLEICYPATVIADPVYDGGSTTIDTTPPCPPKGKFLYAKCEGNDYVTYVEDGNCKKVVGSRVVNSTKCVVPPPPPPPPPPGNPCPAAGTFKSDKCDGTQLQVFVYTGNRGSDGNCTIRMSSSKTDAKCAPPPPKPPPKPIIIPDPPPIIVDDPGDISVPDPIVVTPAPKPPPPPPDPPAPPPVPPPPKAPPPPAVDPDPPAPPEPPPPVPPPPKKPPPPPEPPPAPIIIPPPPAVGWNMGVSYGVPNYTIAYPGVDIGPSLTPTKSPLPTAPPPPPSKNTSVPKKGGGSNMRKTAFKIKKINVRLWAG